MGKKSRERMTDETEEQREEKAKERQHTERVGQAKVLIERVLDIARIAKAKKELLASFSPAVEIIECKCKTCLWVEEKIMCDTFDDNCMDKKCEECKEPVEHCDDYKDEKETVKVGEDKKPTKENIPKKEEGS